MTKLKLVLIEFDDAWASCDVDEGGCTQTVVGFVHYEIKKYIVLGQCFYFDGDEVRIKGFFGIPKACITKTRQLKY